MLPIGGGAGGLRLAWIGLDYASVLAALSVAGVTMSATLFHALQVMEGAAVTAMNAGSGP